MIKINRKNIEDIALQYLNSIKSRRFRKTNPIATYYVDHLDEIILVKPAATDQINQKFLSLYALHKADFHSFRAYMDNQYKRMCMEIGNWLAKELNVNTCPYCNRQYTFTIDKKKKIRPQFDHFLSKSKHPHFALSFYNLIPCCPTCNHIKSDTAEELLYPYDEGFESKCYFKTNHVDFMINRKELEIQLETITECDEHFKARCNNSIHTFALQELYEQHLDYAEEIIIKAYSYNEDYYQGLTENFSKMGKSKNEIQRLIFGNHIDRASNERRPLSKLTSDLLEHIGIVECLA
ncbi:HNH endonuclease [Pedobacter deserti]|uniref:HNH endonuclease n=1 Tax=Pedobacter deserti TaxID=2817382 RepID=UPI00210D2884|nr:hypothetical protein [Pedobacter sp. SYSU D00382]